MLTTDSEFASERGLKRGLSRRVTFSRSVLSDLVRFIDLLVVGLSSFLAYSAYNLGYLGDFGSWPVATGATLIGLLIGVNVLNLAKLYEFDRLISLRYQLTRVVSGWTATIGILIVLVFLTKTAGLVSRGWLVLWWAGSIFGLVAIRVIVKHMIQSWQESGVLQRNVAIVGATQHAARIIAWLRQHLGSEVVVVGVFDDRRKRAPAEVDGIPVLGTTDDLLSFAREHDVEQVIIALPTAAEDRILSVVSKLRQLPSQIDVSLDLTDTALMTARLGHMKGMPLLHIVERPLKDWQSIWKGLEDRIVATLILVLIAPLMLVISAAIALESPGPVIFRQRRHGFNNCTITVYKFRTMRHDMGDPSGTQQTVKDDPRITNVGRLLRRTNLDELPQFINVLQGRLSVVGPRPHVPAMRAADMLYHEAVDEYALRHRVKPGITGWAQVNGLRGETDTMEKATKRVLFDLYYIDHWSLGFDLKIIALTVLRSFRDPNAY